jgi:hypothetical protein
LKASKATTPTNQQREFLKKIATQIERKQSPKQKFVFEKKQKPKLKTHQDE